MKKIAVLAAMLVYIVSGAQPAGKKPGSQRSLINKTWQTGGILYGKKPEEEMLSLRTEFTKKFKRPDGNIDLIFGGPFHYQDKYGDWQDIDLTIKPSTSSGYKYQNETNRFITRFPEMPDMGVNLAYKKQLLTIGLGINIHAGNWVPGKAQPVILAEGNDLTYGHIYKSIDLTYKVTTDALLHKLLFKDKNMFSGLDPQTNVQVEETIELPAGTFLSDENGRLKSDRAVKGNLMVIKGNDTIFSIVAPRAWDASYISNDQVYGDANGDANGAENVKKIVSNVHFLAGNRIKLTGLIPATWLQSTTRAYPVTFDPTVYLGGSTNPSATYRYPFNTCRMQRISQILFHKSDIGVSGTISSIGFYKGNSNGLPANNVTIKMLGVNWSPAAMTSSTHTPSSTLTQVASNVYLNASVGWNDIPTSSFAYNNAQDLLIETRFINSAISPGCDCNSTSPGGYWGYVNASYNGHRWAYSNSSAPPPTSYPGSPDDCPHDIEANPSYGNLIPATRMTITTNPGCTTPAAPVNVSSIATSPTAANFSWAAGTPAGSPSVTYYWVVGTSPSVLYGSGVDQGFGANTTASTSALLCETQYYLRVYASTSCDGSTSSYVTSTAFKTQSCPQNCNPPLAPANVIAKAISSFEVMLNWPAVTGAVSYNIYECSSGNYVGNSTSNSFDKTGLSPSTPYSYKIKSIDSKQCLSQDYSACVNITTPPNNPTSYNITGKVTTSAGVGIAGVIITTPLPQPQYSATTDASGNYTITGLPNSYAGSVSASLSNYTFTPASLAVNASSNTAKNFTGNQKPPITISITNSSIPSWQREGDNLAGSITASYSNMPIGGIIQLDIYSNGIYCGTVSQWPAESASSVHKFDFDAAAVSLNPKPVNGDKIGYQLIYNATSSYADLNQYTPIIEEKWGDKNIVYYNDDNGNNEIKIPVKYDVDHPAYFLGFFRTPGSSTASSILNAGLRDFTLSTDGYFHINTSNSNLSNIEPGVFTYKIYYKNNINPIIENGSIDLTKIGHLSSSNTQNDTLLVLIGGNRNSMEQDIKYLKSHANNDGNPSNNFSIGENFSFGNLSAVNANYNVWYIAQPNTNYIENNGYDIGNSLGKIVEICRANNLNIQQFNILAHSFGGVQLRAALEGLGKRIDGTSNIPFANYNIPYINNLVFLASPHKGVTSGSISIIDGNASSEMKFGSQFLNNIENGLMPAGIKILNITGNDPNNLLTTYEHQASDGVVPVWSSGQPQIKTSNNSYYTYPSLIQQYVFYDENGFTGLHTAIHETKVLNKSASVCDLKISNLQKIFTFLRGQPETSCDLPPNPDMEFVLNGSILPSALISLKYAGDSIFGTFGYADENGYLKLTPFKNVEQGDSILVRTNGYDPFLIPVNKSIADNKKIVVSMFKAQASSAKIQYASVKLINQNPITNNPSLYLAITAKNASKIQISAPYNQDSIFNDLSTNNGNITVALDTGFNRIFFRFIGTDTILLSKEVFYFPDSLMSQLTRPVLLSTNNQSSPAKMFVNDIFVKLVNTNDSIRIQNGHNKITFSKFGYKDTTYFIDSINNINIQLQPYSYSSLIDSSIYNFNENLNPLYWKNISLKNASTITNIQISAKQYDDLLAGMSLIPLTRKFVFRSITTNPVLLKTAIALDQAITPDRDSAYLLSIKNGTYAKYEDNKINLTEYDPEVQKLAFDSISLQAGETQAIVLMKKQAPIVLRPASLQIYEGQKLSFPLKLFVADPDSIKNDLGVVSLNGDVVVEGDSIYLIGPFGANGSYSFTLSLTHDFITVNATYTIKVLQSVIKPPNAFTPNNDGINDRWVITNLDRFPNSTVQIFDRSGSLIYHSSGNYKPWDGTINGKPLPFGTYYYIIDLKEKSYQKLSGSITILR